MGDTTLITVEPRRFYEVALEDDNAALVLENKQLKEENTRLRQALLREAKALPDEVREA
jgi:cell division protein FtsB